jgi:hypothetical protein
MLDARGSHVAAATEAKQERIASAETAAHEHGHGHHARARATDT